jgi:hypothetical protein
LDVFHFEAVGIGLHFCWIHNPLIYGRLRDGISTWKLLPKEGVW